MKPKLINVLILYLGQLSLAVTDTLPAPIVAPCLSNNSKYYNNITLLQTAFHLRCVSHHQLINHQNAALRLHQGVILLSFLKPKKLQQKYSDMPKVTQQIRDKIEDF